MSDPIADALRPRFARAAKEAREILEGGGLGEVQVLGGHLPRAVINITNRGMGPGGEFGRSFNMSIPSVIGHPDDPEAILAFITREVGGLRGPDDVERACQEIQFFESRGPGILADAVRSCIFCLVTFGVSPDDIAALARDALASAVMKS